MPASVQPIRPIALAGLLSALAHAVLLLALRAPPSDSGRLDRLPDLRLWIERPAEREVRHDELGAVRRSVATVPSRGALSPPSVAHGPSVSSERNLDAGAPLPLEAGIAASGPAEPLDTAAAGQSAVEAVSSTAADGGRAIAVAERQMLAGRIKEWSQGFQSADLLGTRISWRENGRSYEAVLQRVPAADDMAVERVLVEVMTEDAGQLLKSRMQMKRLAFSHFTQLVDYWDTEVQLHDDEIAGRFHSNTEIVVGWDRKVWPRFLGQFTTGARSFSIASAMGSKSRGEIFRGGIETGAQIIALPRHGVAFENARRATRIPTLLFDRDSHIEFHADGSVSWRAAGTAEPEQRIGPTDAPVYLVGGSGVSLSVHGVVRGTALVYAPHDIVVTGNLRYAGDPRAGGTSADYLGLAADRNVVIAGHDETGAGDLRIDAAVYARRRFVVRDLNLRRQGTLFIYGSLSAGTLSATEPRYATRIEFDRRFEGVRPPGFPMTNRYELEEWDGRWQSSERD